MAMITMTHADIAGSATATSEAFTDVWQPKGWVLVDPETLLSHLPAPMHWAGDWSSSRNYEPGDGVEISGQMYVALQVSRNKAPASEPTFWEAVSGAAGGVVTVNGRAGTVVGLAEAADLTVRIANTQTVDYTLVLTDAGKAVEVNSATAKNVTVPPNASVAFPVGTIIEVPQVAAGAATLVAGGGVTITGDTVTPGQGGSLLLRKTGTNAWWSAIASLRSGTYVPMITVLTTGGVVDNTATLTAKIAALVAAGFGVGRLPVGTFLTEMPAVPSDFVLEGSGWGTKLILKPQTGGAAGQAFSVVGIYGTVGAHVSNAHIRNMRIDGNKANHTAPAYTDQEGIQFKYADNCSVTGCLIENAVADGIDCDYAVDCLIADNVLKNCGGSGIHISDGSTGNVVRGNIATGNGATFSRAGISDYSNASDNTFVGNVSHDNYRNYELIGFRERFGPSNASYGTVTGADILTGVADANKLLIGGAPVVNYMQSGSYYGPLGQTSSGSQGTGVMTVAPLFVPRPLALDRIACRVTLAAASSTVRLGIYNDDGTGKPGTLVLDAGTVDTTTTGDKELTIAQNLRPGLYWLAAASQGGAPTLRTQDGQAHSMGAILLAEALTTPSGCYTQTGVTAGLPAPFGTPVIGKTPARVVVRVV